MVTTSTGRPGWRSRRRARTLSPSASGSSRSSRTRSRASSPARSRASAPDAASPATSIPSAPSMLLSPSRTMGWSSTTRARTGPSGTVRHGLGAAHGQFHRHAGAPAASAGDRAGAPEQPRTLAHAGQTEAARGAGRLAGQEPHPVVPHLHAQPFFVKTQLDLHRGAARMPRGVGQRLLDDPEYGRLDGRGEAHVAEAVAKLGRPAGIRASFLEAPANRLGETERVDGRGAEGSEHPARLHDGALQPRRGPGQLAGRPFGIVGNEV